jgi:hypothetical protein
VAGVEWFAASLDRILDLAGASDVDAGLADDLTKARDLALMIGDWAKHTAASGGYFFTVSIHMRSDDRDDDHTFTVPHDPDAAEFMAGLTRQLAQLAGQRAQDGEVAHALTELTAIAAGLTKALVESLTGPGPEGSPG